MPYRRPLLAALCMVSGALALLAGALLSDAGRLLRSDTFADRVAASLQDERVAAYAAERLTEAIIAQNRDLTALRPLILAASMDAVGSAAFRGVVRGAARRAHAAVFSEFGRSVVLSIPDLEVVLRGALAGSPGLAESLPDVIQLGDDFGEQPAVRAALAVMQVGVQLGRFAPLLLGLGVLLMAAGVLVMPDRRDSLVGAGAAFIAIGVALWALVPVGATIVARSATDPATSGALAGLWTVALAGIPTWALMYGAIGVVLAAAGSSLLERLDVPELVRRGGLLFITEPRDRRMEFLRGLAYTAAGVLAIFAPAAMLSLLMVLSGILLAFIGCRELFAAVLHSTPAHARFGRAVVESGEGWAVGAMLVTVLAAVFVSAITLTSRTVVAERVPTTIDVCNGAAALCDRRLDEVVFAATHNSMSSADLPDWLFPQQERGIAAQLGDGIRALLIDVYAGTRVGERVKTELTGSAMLAQAERVLGPEGTAAAMRTRARLVGSAEGPRRLYLCHGLCELGAIRADSALGVVRDFLLQHPNEVLLLVVEDYVSPEDLTRAFQESRLASFVYTGPAGEPWPTLREMIAHDQRVVVLIESGRGGVPWLLPAFEVMQETPYTFPSPRDTLSCAPNRGGTTGSLFQLNHWIETTPAPRPSNAAVVNAAPVLLERVRRCERARGIRPNVIAVDFYRTGDLLGVVRVLNGVESEDALSRGERSGGG